MRPRRSPLLPTRCKARAGTLKLLCLLHAVVGAGRGAGAWQGLGPGGTIAEQAGSACCARAQAGQRAEGEKPLCCEPLLFPWVNKLFIFTLVAVSGSPGWTAAGSWAHWWNDCGAGV